MRVLAAPLLDPMSPHAAACRHCGLPPAPTAHGWRALPSVQPHYSALICTIPRPEGHMSAAPVWHVGCGWAEGRGARRAPRSSWLSARPNVAPVLPVAACIAPSTRSGVSYPCSPMHALLAWTHSLLRCAGPVGADVAKRKRTANGSAINIYLS